MDEKKRNKTKKRKNMPNNDLKQLAMDIANGKVFTSNQIKNESLLASVFMPLALMNDEQIHALHKAPPHMLYEYMDKAVPMSVNGMPIFGSVRFLNKTEYDKMIKFYKDYEKTIENWKGEKK